ncbi:YceI family protein [Marinobacteraceae bacterium S3BR75-40.1]
MLRRALYPVAAMLLLVSSLALAENPSGTYAFDTKGQHQFIIFRISHLGFSQLYGEFTDFDGQFTYDADSPEQSSVEVTIQTASVESNHAERDKHLRSDDFLYVDEYPTATFKSTSIDMTGDGKARVTGDFTLRGVTREVVLDMEQVGHGADPWGGYRMGFKGMTTLKLADFGITKDLGPTAKTVDIILSMEGVRQ